MNYRTIDEINNEISEVKSILEPMEKYLSKNPDDLSVKSNARNLNDRLSQLYREISFIKNKTQLTTFDIYLSNVEGGKIKLSNLLNTVQEFQETLISCLMYDGVHPVLETSQPSKDILEYCDLDVEIAQTNSIRLILSVNDMHSNLNNESPLKWGLENLNEIIECEDDKEKLNNLKNTLGSQPLHKYKKLLKILKDNDLNLDIFDIIIPPGFKTQKLSNEFARKVYDTIDNVDNL